jgi:hypothetical protein
VRLTKGITLVPVLHGRSAFAAEVRALCARESYDCIAVDLPEPFEDSLGPAVETLPLIQAVFAREIAEERCYYVPIDPCDAMIEGIRQSLQNRIPFACIGPSSCAEPTPLPPLPDEYSMKKIGFDVFSALCLQAIGNPAPDSVEDRAADCAAARLHELAATHRNILALVHFRHYARVVYHFGLNEKSTAAEPGHYQLSTHFVNPDHLYFALGELPFVTGKFEGERYDPFAAPLDIVNEIKNLFRETRDAYRQNDDDANVLSPARIQTALTFLRNLTVSSGFLLPTLFDIVEAAKGVGGNAFALRILKNARYYPYLPFELGAPLAGVGIDRVSLPDRDEPFPAVNLFRDTVMLWRTISIRPDPTLDRKKKYRYTWNPLGMCSHVPEDVSIERFNDHVRAKSRRIMVEELARHEKFTTSVKDGIDIRETLRNWHTGSVYVKEIPPSRGKVDTVVIIFDDQHDERYPQHTTWYAEHPEESTLTFYATDPFGDLIGPGVARCRYGGLSLLFPPRSVPDVFELTKDMDFPSLSARLTFGALLFSAETNVAYVAARKPGVALKTIASRMKKRLIWIPLASFSSETVNRLKKFHILNGKEVRSWAARFIGED